MYIDDASCAQTLDLDKMLVPLIETEGPHGRMAGCGMAIPGEWLTLQHKLRDVVSNAKTLGMKVNDSKTKLIVFNETHNRQAIPMVAAYPGQPLQCVSELRLLGLIFDEHLSWWPLIRDLASRARAKLWGLVRLRDAGAGSDVLLANYTARIRSILELGAQVWGTFVNGAQSKCIEDCQAHALLVILGSQASSYSKNRLRLGLELLSVRRDSLIRKFAISSFKDPKHRCWYKPSPPPPLDTRIIVPRFCVPSYRTMRSDLIPITRYTQELNNLTDTEWKDLGLPHISTCYHLPNVQLSRLYSMKTNTGVRATSSCTSQSSPALPPSVSQRPPVQIILSTPPRSQLPVIVEESIDDEILYLMG